MGHSASKEISIPHQDTPAFYMYRGYGPHTCRFLGDWNRYTRSFLSKEFPLEGTFEMDRVSHLCSVLTDRGREVRPYQWAVYIAWYQESCRRAHQTEMEHLAASQEKLNAEMKTLKAQVSLERKKRPAPLPVGPNSGSGDPPGARQNPVSDTGRAQPPLSPATSPPVPSAPGPGPAAAAQPPWSCHELFHLARSFPDVNKEPERFRETLRAALVCYRPSFPEARQLMRAVLPEDLFALLTMEAGMLEEAGWEQPWLEALSRVCPRKSDWHKIAACKQRPGEDPSEFMERLAETVQRWSGAGRPFQDEGIVGRFFLEGLLPEIKNRVMQLSPPGGTAFGLQGLLELAADSWSKKQRKEEEQERQLRALQLRDLRSRVHGTGGRGTSHASFHAVRIENYPAITYETD